MICSCNCVMGDVDQWQDPGFDPLAEQGEKQFFCPSECRTLIQTCVCLTPLRVYSTQPKFLCRLNSHLLLTNDVEETG